MNPSRPVTCTLAISTLLLALQACTALPTDNKHTDNHPEGSGRAPQVLAAPTSPRVQPIAVQDMNAEQRALLGIVDGKPVPRRATMNLFQTFMHHPELMSLYFPLGDRVSRVKELPDRDRELIIMRTAWRYNAEYEWAQHYAPATRAGLTPREIEDIKQGSGVETWSNFDRTLLDAADQLVDSATVDDAVWSALRSRYSVQDIMALITLAAHYHWVAMMSKTLGIEIEDGQQGFVR